MAALVEIFANHWECDCGSRYFSVLRTEHDEDYTPIRIRTCNNCGQKKATIEKEIPLDSYFARAHSKSFNARKARQRKASTCKRCLRPYRVGYFSHHVLEPTHLETVKHHLDDMQRKTQRDRKREYQRRRRNNVIRALPRTIRKRIAA